MPRLRSCLLVSVAALLACANGGCAWFGYTYLTIKPAEGTNQGRALYMVVRGVDQKTYMTESYAEVAAKVTNADSTVIKTVVLYPGIRKRELVKKPGKATLALYFLFTTPVPPWKVLLDPQPSWTTVHLGASAISTQDGVSVP